uniref:Uncharacterized protein n=1 Tax=Glossina brevipalpis TaxID=37001 RepID=A0A1A9X0T3_9MUSC
MSLTKLTKHILGGYWHKKHESSELLSMCSDYHKMKCSSLSLPYSAIVSLFMIRVGILIFDLLTDHQSSAPYENFRGFFNVFPKIALNFNNIKSHQQFANLIFALCTHKHPRFITRRCHRRRRHHALLSVQIEQQNTFAYLRTNIESTHIPASITA